MAWTPLAAVLWALAYGAVRVWWAVRGAPSFGRLGIDLIAFKGWSAAGLCAAAAAVALAIRTARWRPPLLAAAWAVCAALLVACPLLLLDVVAGLLPGTGIPPHPVGFLSRAACLVECILLGAAAVAYRRRWRSACLFCGRTGKRVRLAQTPRWAWWAAYAAIAGWLLRLVAQVALGFDFLRRAPRAFLGFEAGFILAGTVLPLALVHPWGRRVPRWLPLGPAFAIGGGLTVYFGVGLVAIAAATLHATWRRDAGSPPLAFFWVAMPAYEMWGLGLLAAAVAYYQVTRPPCRVCGQ